MSFSMFLHILFLGFNFVVLAGASSDYSVRCNSAFCKVLDESNQQISSLKLTVDEGLCIPGFGAKADEICNSAMERFALEVPLGESNKTIENEQVYEKKIEDLEKLLDSPLHVIYLIQLAMIREKAIKAYKQGLSGSKDSTEFEAMLKADELFRREADDSTRQNPEWSYAREISSLKTTLQDLASRSKQVVDAGAQSARHTTQYMQYIQSQQQQMEALKQQLMSGASSPWSVQASYRIPETNINSQLTYQQGRVNIQVSCIPDDSAPLLGRDGFVNGVTPGNVGFTFNVNV